MAVTQYKAVTWSPNELISNDKMNQLSTNMDWLAQNTPRAMYSISGLKTQQGIKIVGGMAFCPASSKAPSEHATVTFSGFFSPNCMPIITTGLVTIPQGNIGVYIKGLSGLKPDARGFDIYVRRHVGKNIPRSFYVSWQALGY